MSPGANRQESLHLQWPLSLIWATADLAVISLTVDIATLTVLPIDHLVGDVAGVTHTLPTDAVPQPRAQAGTIVFLEASLQFPT